MSYEPTIVILKKDLDKHENYILDGDWQYNINSNENIGEDGLTVMQYIQKIYKNTPVKLGGIEFFICSPTFTSFNKKIRDKLMLMEVEYQTHL